MLRQAGSAGPSTSDRFRLARPWGLRLSSTLRESRPTSSIHSGLLDSPGPSGETPSGFTRAHARDREAVEEGA